MSQNDGKKLSLLRKPIHMSSGIAVLLCQWHEVPKATMDFWFAWWLITYFAIVEVARIVLSRSEDWVRERTNLLNWYYWLMDVVFLKYGGMHEHEKYRETASAYYWAALGLIYYTLPFGYVAPAVLILAFGDSAASIFGTRFGKPERLLRGKSIVGCCAFFIASVTMITLSYWIDYDTGTYMYRHLNPLHILAAIGVAGLIEVYAGKYDNFAVPVTTVAVLLFIG